MAARVVAGQSASDRAWRVVLFVKADCNAAISSRSSSLWVDNRCSFFEAPRANHERFERFIG